MAPTKSRMPLPTSHSSIFVLKPMTFDQWQVAAKRVKLLYLKRQSKQCAAHCTQLLLDCGYNVHPVIRASVLFYSAICFEILARAAHHFSSNKLLLLHKAKDAYTAAIEALPIPNVDPDDDILDEDEHGAIQSIEFDRISVQTITTSDSDTRRSSLLTPALTDESSTASTTDFSEIFDSITDVSTGNTDEYDSDIYFDKFPGPPTTRPSSINRPISIEASLCPAPLNIRKAKVVHFDTSPEKYSHTRPRPLPIRSALTLVRSPSMALIEPTGEPRTTFPSSNSMSSFLLSRSLSRYNGELASFRPHIKNHIKAVDELIVIAEEVREERRGTRAVNRLSSSNRMASFWSFKAADDESQTQEKKDRIARLKARGWKLGVGNGVGGWKGSRYYEELCEKALKEVDERC